MPNPPKAPLYCAHLVDDHTGSPLVLRTLVSGLREQGQDIRLILSSARLDGPLHQLPGPRPLHYFFRWSSCRTWRFTLYALSQLHLFLLVLLAVPRHATLLVNTLLPCGAALAGRLKGLRVVYHVHENRIPPAPFDAMLKAIARQCASRLVFVSAHSASLFPAPAALKRVVPNGLSADFLARAEDYGLAKFPSPYAFRACMASYPRTYKGVDVLVQLARRMPGVNFSLALSADTDELETWLSAHRPQPSNLEVLGRQEDLHAFYAKSHLLLNLTLPDQAVETFGMTVLEGMAHGLPAIVPPVGGVAELARDAQEGFHADARFLEGLMAKIELLRLDTRLWERLSTAARKRALEFGPLPFLSRMEEELREPPPA